MREDIENKSNKINLSPLSLPLKLLHFEDGVNTTLGLPIIRTSVDHGTAYDIAWKGVASPASMKAAIKMAVEMARKKKGSRQGRVKKC